MMAWIKPEKCRLINLCYKVVYDCILNTFVTLTASLKRLNKYLDHSLILQRSKTHIEGNMFVFNNLKRLFFVL
jgi:hypothetical protein